MRIGLFDSGVGGLTCLGQLMEKFPKHEYVYLGDTARLPYGTKSRETIRKYAEQNIAFLKKQNVDIVISACHSASSALISFKMKDDIPLYEVITPACQQVAGHYENIGLIATASTVESGIYSAALETSSASTTLHQKAAPLLVPLVESGWTDDPITDSVIERYLEPLKQKGIQALILGCTHFPALKEAIAKYLGPDIVLVDPGEALALSLSKTLCEKMSDKGSLQVFITDDSPHFIQLAKKLLPKGSNLTIELSHL